MFILLRVLIARSVACYVLCKIQVDRVKYICMHVILALLLSQQLGDFQGTRQEPVGGFIKAKTRGGLRVGG